MGGGVFCERKEMQELVKLEQVTKEFEKRRIIEAVTCEIKKGEIWWIRGASGGGKTTFLRMLAGLGGFFCFRFGCLWGWGSGISTECMKVKVRWLDFCKDYFS